MRCVDCELHDYVVGTHFCNYKGKSGRRRPRRVSEEDAHKDVPCEFVEEMKGAVLSEVRAERQAIIKMLDSDVSKKQKLEFVESFAEDWKRKRSE